MMRGPPGAATGAFTQAPGILHSVPGVVRQSVQILEHGLRPAPRANTMKPRCPWNCAQSCLAPYGWLSLSTRELALSPPSGTLTKKWDTTTARQASNSPTVPLSTQSGNNLLLLVRGQGSSVGEPKQGLRQKGAESRTVGDTVNLGTMQPAPCLLGQVHLQVTLKVPKTD